jgi:outer membrane murein-binding lipoprotein Lpp
MGDTKLLIPGQVEGSYKLLNDYMIETKVLSEAYKKSEAHWRNVSKMLNYPLIVITTLMSVFSSIELNKYVLMALSFGSMLITSFATAVAPKDREAKANQISTEFGEIASNIRQFINENHKTKEEVKAFSQMQLELIEIWKGLSPPINDKYIKQSKIHNAPRTRSGSPPIKYKEEK